VTKATLLTIATIRSGIIVFMKNDEKTRNAATQAVITSHIWDLPCPFVLEWFREMNVEET
jgi:hypothetical protein